MGSGLGGAVWAAVTFVLKQFPSGVGLVRSTRGTQKQRLYWIGGEKRLRRTSSPVSGNAQELLPDSTIPTPIIRIRIVPARINGRTQYPCLELPQGAFELVDSLPRRLDPPGIRFHSLPGWQGSGREYSQFMQAFPRCDDLSQDILILPWIGFDGPIPARCLTRMRTRVRSSSHADPATCHIPVQRIRCIRPFHHVDEVPPISSSKRDPAGITTQLVRFIGRMYHLHLKDRAQGQVTFWLQSFWDASADLGVGHDISVSITRSAMNPKRKSNSQQYDQNPQPQ